MCWCFFFFVFCFVLEYKKKEKQSESENNVDNINGPNPIGSMCVCWDPERIVEWYWMQLVISYCKLQEFHSFFIFFNTHTHTQNRIARDVFGHLGHILQRYSVECVTIHHRQCQQDKWCNHLFLSGGWVKMLSLQFRLQCFCVVKKKKKTKREIYSGSNYFFLYYEKKVISFIPRLIHPEWTYNLLYEHLIISALC